MTVRDRTKKVLAMLLPAGVLGISAALAAVQSEPWPAIRDGGQQTSSVAERLHEIRNGVSAMDSAAPDANAELNGALLANWLNFGGGLGWRNGGWGNGGGWHNGGWGNGGWHNAGWGNGGWHNAGWGNGGGWHNWHNFWHNW